LLLVVPISVFLVSLKLVQRSLVSVPVSVPVSLWFRTTSTFPQVPIITTNMVDIEEISEEKSPEGALAYMVEFVFPQDTDTLLSFLNSMG
jgi:hypothetical protein